MPRAFAPGRVNLIGEHTDYTGGFVLPIAVQLGTTVDLEPGGALVSLTSADEAGEVEVALDVVDPASNEPAWGRYVAGVVAELRPANGGTGTVRTTLPIGAGLSSSAALEVACALALGFDGDPLALALLCQRAEQRASGVPCGIMDQLASAAGRSGHALLIDCTTNAIDPVRLPEGLEVVAVHSGEQRRLAGSAYADRRAACEAAAEIVGPLRDASLADLKAIRHDVVRRRARHVLTENARTLECVAALRSGDLVTTGDLVDASHRSLRDDFEVSTPTLDALVERVRSMPGVFGARLTGAGFGGCAVALCEPGALREGWRLEAADGARVLSPGDATELDR
ncbi:MAG: galactokinase [Microthrixaceae bacterium]